jgi:hypothetical protein
MSVRGISSPPSSPPSPPTTSDSTPTSPPRTTSDAITTSSSNEVTEKHQLRALTRKVINTVVPKVAVRRAIELYDLEKPYTEQPEEVMDEVEQILMMKGIQWSTPGYRRMMISEKMRVALMAVLRSYGRVFFFSSVLLKLANVPYRYKIFSYYGENKKARLQIAPKPGQEPPPLPEWLQIPYLVPVKGFSSKIIYDSCVNPATRSGDGLYDQAERIVGTLGAVMSSSRPGKADAYIALTSRTRHP